ncbi:MAG: GNAT family N-acetyltransferase [Schleiferiaceae bacterium]
MSASSITKKYLSLHETERCTLRPLVLEDAQWWMTFFEDEGSLQYFPQSMRHKPNASSQWIEKQLNRYSENAFGLLAVLDLETQQPLGQIGLLLQEVNGHAMLEVGYHLLPSARGRGIAREISSYLVEWGLAHTDFSEIISIIHPDNIPSQKVAESNGMTRGPIVDYKGIPVYIYSTSS